MNDLTGWTKFDTIITIATGHVVQHRICHANRALRDRELIDQIAYCGIEPEADSPLQRVAGEHYFQIRGDQIPFDELSRAGLLAGRPLFVVATNSSRHVRYALQAVRAGFAAAVEKPLALSPGDAERLLEAGGEVYPIEHFAYKAPVVEWLHDCRAGRGPDLDQVREVRVRILEEQPADPRRLLDGMTWDLGSHALALVRLPVTLQGHVPRCQIRDVQAASHSGAVGLATAVRIRGGLSWPGGRLPFDIQIGKGMIDRKELEVVGPAGPTVSLAEGGFQAHLRQLTHLVSRPPGEHFLRLADAVELVRLCHDAETRTQMQPGYAVGAVPTFLRGELALAV